MKSVCKLLIFSAIMFASTVSLGAAPGWEQLKSGERLQQTRVVKHTPDIEVRTARGVIIVSTNRTVGVKVFSILGQLVSQETLQPGTSMLSLNMHGVFIVKIGDTTCKVAL